MADFADSYVPPDMDENETRLPISSEKPADVASPYALSSSVPEAAKNDEEEFKKLDQSHGEVLEKSWKLISCGNRSSENANMEQEVSRYRTCNRVTALQNDKSDADCSRSDDSRCGMHEDLLFDIMLWLPVASLLRFRSVCRLWRSLIDSSTFITQHYNHNSNKSCLLAHHVVLSDNDDYDSKFCLLSGNKYEVYSSLDYEQSWYSVNEITLLNSCNGIVPLLNGESGDVALWNPATKQLRPLPKSSISRQFQSLCYKNSASFGFGFDAKSSDYKVVKIYHCLSKRNSLVEVYNLRTDSWRTIHKDDVLPFQYFGWDGTIFKKGTCFWIGYTHHDGFSPILISFDLNNEVFETIPLPGEHHPDYCVHAYHALDLLNDKLCYIQDMILDQLDIGKSYEIWMLGEYGVKESWKKIWKFNPTGSLVQDFPHVLGFSKNGEFLLLGPKYIDGELYLSNFDAREEEYLELQNPKPLPSKFVCYNKLQNPNPDISEVVCYNESLVSLKRVDDGTYK